MDTAHIIEELENGLNNVNRAIAALQGNRAKRGRPAGKTNGPKRHMTAAQRKRIGVAMKKKWAERKKKAAE